MRIREESNLFMDVHSSRQISLWVYLVEPVDASIACIVSNLEHTGGLEDGVREGQTLVKQKGLSLFGSSPCFRFHM